MKQRAKGRTPLGAQYALMEELETLFDGKTYCGKTDAGESQKKPLNIFKQDLPIPSENDEDTEAAAILSPFIIVRRTGTAIQGVDKPQAVEMEILICCYDESKERDGYDDVANISDAIVQRFQESAYYGNAFTIEYPIASAVQQDDTSPYYFGDVILNVNTQVRTENTKVEDLI